MVEILGRRKGDVVSSNGIIHYDVDITTIKFYNPNLRTDEIREIPHCNAVSVRAERVTTYEPNDKGMLKPKTNIQLHIREKNGLEYIEFV